MRGVGTNASEFSRRIAELLRVREEREGPRYGDGEATDGPEEVETVDESEGKIVRDSRRCGRSRKRRKKRRNGR